MSKLTHSNTYNNFASDNVTSACPEVMDAVVAANAGIATSYAEDRHSVNLETIFSKLFGKRNQSVSCG